jgi:urease accessory protein UreF
MGGRALPANNMVKQKQLVLDEAAQWLGDFHPLAEQLGCADGLAALGAVTAELRLAPVHDLPSLHRFLATYHSQVLIPLELRAIRRAYAHAARGHARELIALDRQLAREPAMQPFAAASRRVGRSQLRKLRPLRDERVVQRYLHAVEAGEAHAWHTLVYGMTLAVYSLPLRQGLLGYAQHTTRGFIHAATRDLRLSEQENDGRFDDLYASLPRAIEPLLAQGALRSW